MKKPIIYVFDFDGVICDSVMETAITGWKAAGSIWKDMPDIVPQDKVDQFRLVRPIIETGYEAIMTMRLLYLELPIDAIYRGYREKFNELIETSNLTVDSLKKLFGYTRDTWIKNDLSGWVNMNPFYEGVAAKLKALNQHDDWYIVTTKHERFVKLILQANAINFGDNQIFGLDRNLSKVDVLKRLMQDHPKETIYFVEDRLPTLLNVLKHDELLGVKLFFSLWGYNTADDKVHAGNQEITVLKLKDFLGL